ncbi:tetratricopeptide repeat protein [Actinophytocola sp. KF-1]
MAARAVDNGPMLVVADNASALDQVLPLRPGASVHRMLVTSRHTLPIPRARRVELDELPMVDALAMLASSLTASAPQDSRITAEPEHAATLAELCGKLPLALGITAHLLADHPGRPLGEMVTLLRDAHDRIAEFAYGGSVAVRASFDASYRRLPAEQARTFRVLALNPGPHIGLEAAAALLDLPADTARHLVEELRRANLLQPATGNNYRFHDLLRLYAEDLCRREQPGADEALERLLAYYEHVVVAADSHVLNVPPEGGRSPRFVTRDDALAWFDAERPNLVAAVERAAVCGHHGHAITTTHHMYWYFQLRKHWSDWMSTHEVALAAARAAGDDIAVATILNRIGNIHQEQSQPQAAVPCYEEALTLFEGAADLRGQANTLVNLGVVFSKFGHLKTALDHHDRALTLYQRIGDREGESKAFMNAGVAYRDLGHPDEALRRYQHATDICQELGNRAVEAQCLSNLANLYADLDAFEDSLTAFHAAIAIYREMSDEAGAGLAWANLGVTHRDRGEVDHALACFTQALTAYQAISATARIEWVRRLIASLPSARRKERRTFWRRRRSKSR